MHTSSTRTDCFAFLVALALTPAVLAGCESTPPATDAGGSDGGGGTDASASDTGTDAPIDTGVDAYVRPVAPPLYTESTLTGDALAREALRLLGAPAAGGSRSCGECHGITRRRVHTWAEQVQIVLESCLDDLAVTTDASATEMIACLRDPDGNFRAANAGIFSAAAHLDWFEYVFRQGGGATWMDDHDTFIRRAGMPADARTPFTQAELDIVATWFVRGAPLADTILPDEPPPSTCTPFVSPELTTHVARMSTDGWAATNLEAGILMHGCAGAAGPEGCLSTAQRAADTTYGADWDVVTGSTSRVLHTTAYRSSYWTRSSADGRFVAHGPGRVVDLQRAMTLSIDSPYDPGFFPDNSAFVWPGQVCEQSLLARATGPITFGEPECNRGDIGLYEHVGVALGGGDYWVITGQFTSDNGGHMATLRDPEAAFSRDSAQTLTRIVNDGSTFRTGSEGRVATPFEADATISPSSELMLTRIAGPGGAPLGYSLYRIEAGAVSAGRFDVSLRELGRYCYPGAKTAWSYDERWIVYHHYITDADATDLGFTGPTDPGFAAYRTSGAANVYLIDVATGARTRISNMGPGQYALFPHFRSDGWIYYMVRGATGAPMGGERVVATDAALVLQAE